MEGESSNSGNRRPLKRSRQKRESESISYEKSVENLSEAGKETLRIVNSRKRPLNRIPNTTCAVFDNTCPAYHWLRCRWIAEERVIKPHGRLYRYYYDPIGQMYNTREDVEHTCSKIENNGN